MHLIDWWILNNQKWEQTEGIIQPVKTFKQHFLFSSISYQDASFVSLRMLKASPKTYTKLNFKELCFMFTALLPTSFYALQSNNSSCCLLVVYPYGL